jgi:hypothetical protein
MKIFVRDESCLVCLLTFKPRLMQYMLLSSSVVMKQTKRLSLCVCCEKA